MPAVAILDLERLGARIRLTRRERGMSGRELARRTGVSPGYISLIERGLKTPSLALFCTLADVLGVRAGEFLDGNVQAGGGECSNGLTKS